MKKIEAIIRPGKFDELKEALDAQGVRCMTVTEVKGRGLQKEAIHYYRGQEHRIDLHPKTKVEIVCHDEAEERIISTILSVCRTKEIGDGKIFVYPLERVIRISTREEGGAAL